MEKDKNGWIDGNIYDPRDVLDKKFYHELILVCDERKVIFVSRPVSNDCPVNDYYWQPLPDIPEAFTNHNVRLSSLIDAWFNRQTDFEKIASESVEHHSQIRFNAKAQATRDCWKELKRLIDES